MIHLFQPRHIEYHGKNLPLFRDGKPGYQIVIADDADPLILEAARLICQGIRYPEAAIVSESRTDGEPGIFLCTPAGPSLFARLVERGRIADVPNRDQAFEVEVIGDDIVLLGRTPIAIMHASRTMVDMVKANGGDPEFPDMSLCDYPDLAYRGIYVECRWGPDNMTLDEWKEAIDTLSGMRMNIVSIGLYNNWPIQYHGKISEWMLVPLKNYPKLKTPQTVDYYSPSRKEDVRHEYVPRLFEEDLFGEIIKYAKSRGVMVRPHFNTPGHNTQIPRRYPETSARFPDGSPKLYGFCMSNPATFRTMFGIMDEICDRYLLPNGIDMFHIGLDEVYPLVGMNEDMPLKRIDPWCECPDCFKKSPEDHFVDYAVRLAKHLNEKGINHIGMWHDHFARGGKMNEALARRFEDEGLKDSIVLHWWRYHEFFDTTMPELGLRRWVVPMTGYFYWINYQNHLKNCFLAVEKGIEEGAEGAEAYGVWHQSFHQHYAILAAKSWNTENWPDLHAFRSEYAKTLFGDRWREGMRGLEYFDEITSGHGMLNFLTRFYHYVYSYAAAEDTANHRDSYPRPLIEELLDNPLNVLSTFGAASAGAEKAVKIFFREGLWADDSQELREIYLIECLRLKAVMSLFQRIVNAVQLVRAFADADKVDAAADLITKAIEELESVMLAIEKHWAPPFVPQALRELTLMLKFAQRLEAELRSGPKGELEVMRWQPVDWPN